MKNVSLVVSCGGARGVSAIGVIEELEKEDIIYPQFPVLQLVQLF